MLLSTSTFTDRITASTETTWPLVICYFNEDCDYPFATATATSEYSNYTADKACNGRIREAAYTSEGQIYPELKPTHYGYWSSNTADTNGDFGTTQYLTLSYVNSIKTKNFYVSCPSTCYLVDFDIETSEDGSTWTTLVSVTDNTDALYTYRVEADVDMQYFRIAITKISEASGRIKILQAGALTTVVFDITDVNRVKLIEELEGQNKSPLGKVSANTCSFQLSCDDGFANYYDSGSPLYRALGGQFRFRPFIGVKYSGADTYEFMPLGEFWKAEYNYESSTLVSWFYGYDRLYNLKNETPPILAVIDDSTIKELFEQLFEGIGLAIDDYHVSKYLDQPVPKGFLAGEVGSNFSDEKVGELLQVLAEAGNAYVVCNRWGKIIVRSNFTNDSSEATITDDNFIYAIENMEKQDEVYEGVRVRYKLPKGESGEVLLWESPDYSIPNGGGDDLRVEFSDPVAQVTRIVLSGATNAAATGVEAGAVRMDIEFSNSGAAETVDILVYGKKLNFYNTSYEHDSVDNPASLLKISNWLIQDKATAKSYAENLADYVYDPLRFYKITGRGDPRFEVGDVIAVSDATNGISENLQIVRQVLEWNGVLGLSEMVARKALSEQAWAFNKLHPCKVNVSYPKTQLLSWSGLQPRYFDVF
jgi:hypothetical protein